MIRMTLDCVRPTQFNVIQTIHYYVGLKCFYQNLPKCSFVIIVIRSYFSYISQGNVVCFVYVIVCSMGTCDLSQIYMLCYAM